MGCMCSGLHGAAMAEHVSRVRTERTMAWIDRHVSDARIRLAHAQVPAAKTARYSTDLSTYVQIAYKKWSDEAIAGQPSCCGVLCCGTCRACAEGSAYMDAIAARAGPVSTVMLAFAWGRDLGEWDDTASMLIARATRRMSLEDESCCQTACFCCCVPRQDAGTIGRIQDSYLTVSECASADWHWRRIACTAEEADRMLCFAYDERCSPFDECGARQAVATEYAVCCCPVRTCCVPCYPSHTAHTHRYYCASLVYAILCAGGGPEHSVQRRLWPDAPLVWNCPIDRITATNLVGSICTTMKQNVRSQGGTPFVAYGDNYMTAAQKRAAETAAAAVATSSTASAAPTALVSLSSRPFQSPAIWMSGTNLGAFNLLPRR